MSDMITVKNLSKKYKTRDAYAVSDVSFTVTEGEIIGILGPNGAGKSTLIKMLLGVIKSTSGEVRMLGKDPLKFGNKEKAMLGVYLGGKSNLQFHLPVMDSVKLFGAIYKVPRETFEKNVAHYAKILHCESFLNQRVATLSLGQKLRAELLCILIYEPKILILDEPTLGLDIEGKRQFRAVLRDLVAEQNMSVLITTHDINDMEKISSRILMICNGKKVMDLTSSEYETLVGGKRILLTDGPLAEADGISFLEKENEAYRYLIDKGLLDNISPLLEQNGCHMVAQEPPKLEDVFYEYYR